MKKAYKITYETGIDIPSVMKVEKHVINLIPTSDNNYLKIRDGAYEKTYSSKETKEYVKEISESKEFKVSKYKID